MSSHLYCCLDTDDIKMYMTINSIADCVKLQMIVDRMQSWWFRNLLTININKCNVISFIFEFSISGHALDRLEQMKDLGVTFVCDLSFRSLFSDILTNAYKQKTSVS